MDHIFYSSSLQLSFRKNIEDLLYFNPQQDKIKPKIIRSIEHFGIPTLYEENKLLRIRVGDYQDVQSLFAFCGKAQENTSLIGAAFYFRIDYENIVLLHIAVDEAYSSTGEKNNDMVTMHLITKLRKIASQIKGVRYLNITYNDTCQSKIPV